MKSTNKSTDKVISIRASEAEYEILKSKADLNEMNISQYIKEKLFDDEIIQRNSPQLKILKTISYCAGVLSKIADSKFGSKQDKQDLKEEIERVMIANGIDIKNNN